MRPELFTIPWLHYTVPSYGAMVVIAFLGGTWWMTRRASKVKADPDVCLSLALIALILGWIGGRTFYVIHYWKSQFAANPAQILNITAGGFEVYGGLMLAAVSCVIYLLIKRLSLRLYADLVAPTVLFGMGVGRIGCFLVGCCWGAPCSPELPWAVRFPALSSPAQEQWQNRLMALPAELIAIDSSGFALPMQRQMLKADLQKVRDRLQRANAELAQAGLDPAQRSRDEALQAGLKMVLNHFERFQITPAELARLADNPELRSAPVHPVQLYSAIGPLLLALALNAYFYRRQRHGVVMAFAMIAYGVERFIEEMLRMDNPHDTFGLTVSQSISIGFVLFGIGLYLLLQRLPLRSPLPARRTAPALTPGPAASQAIEGVRE